MPALFVGHPPADQPRAQAVPQTGLLVSRCDRSKREARQLAIQHASNSGLPERSPPGACPNMCALEA
eukprot:8139552-Pyramimonas_sp.AAC.2